MPFFDLLGFGYGTLLSPASIVDGDARARAMQALSVASKMGLVIALGLVLFLVGIAFLLNGSKTAELASTVVDLTKGN